MNKGTLALNEAFNIGPKVLKSNPVADSWQSRAPIPVQSLTGSAAVEDPLDLVGHTLNGRPIYRAWQLALLLGISPALLSSSLNAIPTNLRPFDVFDEDYEVNAVPGGPRVDEGLKCKGELARPEKATRLDDLRRIAVLARTSEGASMADETHAGWNELVGSFREF